MQEIWETLKSVENSAPEFDLTGHYMGSPMNTSEPTPAMSVPSVPPTDAELVDCFVSVRDPEAIRELVQRHGSLILGVSGRVLRDTADIEDVFQATVLVLIQNAARVRRQQSIGSWLYGVAYRLSLRLAHQKRQRRETTLPDSLVNSEGTLNVVADRHDQQIVDAELNALPERYRVPLVLRYLGDQSPSEISNMLGITPGMLDGLLRRGKDLLRAKLVRRGISLSFALAAVQSSQQAVAAAGQSALMERTIQSGLWNLMNSNPASRHITTRAVELSQKEMIAMSTLTKSSLLAGLAAGLIGFGFVGSQFVGSSGKSQVEAGPITQLRTTLSATTSTSQAVVGQESVDTDPVPRVAAPVEIPHGPADTVAVKHRGVIKDLKLRNQIEMRIEQTFQEPTEVAFTENPLEETLHYLSDLHHIEFWIDKTTLAENGVALDTPMSLVMSGVTLRSALQLMLEPLDLDFVVRNEVVTITSRDKAESLKEVRVYDVSHFQGITTSELDEIIRGTIAPNSWSPERQVTGPSMRMGAVTDSPERSGSDKTVVAQDMRNYPPDYRPIPVENPAAQTGFARLIRTGLTTTPAKSESAHGLGSIRFTSKTLIIRQSQRVHAEIADLLNQLRASDDATIPAGNSVR